MTTPAPLRRCAECLHNTKTGEWCQRGHRYGRGRTKIKCAAFRDEYAGYVFGTDHYQETPLADQLMIFDRSGGERLIPWTVANGMDAAVRLFAEWLEDRVGNHLQRQRDARMKADIDQAARGVRASFRVVRPEQEPKP